MSFITLHIHAGLDADRLDFIYERIQEMPTVAELKAAVSQAVGEEAAEVAARLKALEDKIAELTAGQAITEADKEEILGMVRGIFTPT
jgi:hypothetical protein